MKLEVVLKPCPWCKKTPELELPISDKGDGKTWCWAICCRNPECLMQPRSPHVNLRKAQKNDSYQVKFKMGKLADKWNTGNNTIAFEKKIVDITEILP